MGASRFSEPVSFFQCLGSGSVLAAAGAIGLCPGVALAQSGDVTGATSEVSMAITVPPEATNEMPTFRIHDGFYFRLGFGFGYLATGFNSDAASDAGTEAFEASGMAIDAQLMLGGTPAPGLVIGGAFYGNDLFSDVGDHLSYSVGPFIDIYPNPRGGWHLGAMLGLNGQSVRFIPNGELFMVYGGAVAFFAGYEAWVSGDWSMGGFLKAQVAMGSRTIENRKVQPRSNSVTLNVTTVFQ